VIVALLVAATMPASWSTDDLAESQAVSSSIILSEAILKNSVGLEKSEVKVENSVFENLSHGKSVQG
jgi:hypothetical protein